MAIVEGKTCGAYGSLAEADNHPTRGSCTRLPSDSSRLVDEDALQRRLRGPSAITERALSRQHDVPLVGTLWTGTLPAAVDRSAEEVHSRIYT